MKSTVVLVQIDGEREIRGPVLLEPLCESAGTADEIQFPNSLVHFGDNRSCCLRLVNPIGFTQKLEKGSCVGHAREWITADGQVSGAPSNQSNEGVGGEVVEVKTGGVGGKVVVVGESSIRIKSVCVNAAERKKQLSDVLAEVRPSLQWQEKDKLRCLLLNNHHVFAVDERDRGETDLVQMRVDTGDATPRR